MKRLAGWIGLAVACALAPTPASARGLGIEVWTDRGNDAVYQPGDAMQLRTRATDDCYLLVYEIDSDGYVHVLFPYSGRRGFVEARTTTKVPADDSNVDLVVEKATGEGYLVAIASREPFQDLPAYLRPYDPQGDDVGYVNQPDEDDGVMNDGRIVGDPFVAMERIRRRVLRDPSDEDQFATAYTTYYVHEQVRYPRYVCYDCHRPNYWSWWDGFDPYYSRCSVVDFRVNWSWGWGPAYWNGSVPYFVFVPRGDCPPRWRFSGPWVSSWDGWRRWNQIWGGPLTRYKSPPPAGYVPPSKYANWKGGQVAPPPGFLATNNPRWRNVPGGVAVGRGGQNTIRDLVPGRSGAARPGAFRQPAERAPVGDESRGRDGGRIERPFNRPMPSERPRDEGSGDDSRRVERRFDRPAPQGPPREEPARESRRYERPSPPPSPPREERREEHPQRESRPAPAERSGGGDHGRGSDHDGGGRGRREP